jgi:uncharacterized membrane protein
VSPLPSGFALPALPYLVGLLVAAAVAGGLLYRRRPPVTEATVTALTPWMAAGGGLYALFQFGAVPSAVAPLFGSPAVYVSVGVLAAIVWAAVADRPAEGWGRTTAPGLLAGAGGLLLASTVAAAGIAAASSVGGRPDASAAILLVTLVVTAAVWAGLRRVATVEATGSVGVLVVFAHALDGISTAVGYDRLGFGEQTPLSRIIIHAGEALPTAELIGAGWLFVVVKLLLAAGIVALFEEYVREDPTEGYLLLALITAVGLGPGAHNLVLFALV